MAVMKMIRYFDGRVKKLSLIDVKLSQTVAFIAALVVAKYLPQVTSLHVGWYIAAFVLCVIKPVHAFLLKK